MFLVIFSIEDARGRDRGRDLQQNEKNLFVNQLPEGSWYKREGGGATRSRNVGEITQGRRSPFPTRCRFQGTITHEG